MQRHDEMGVKDYWAVLRRRKWAIRFSVLLSLAAAVSLNYLTQPVYRATSRVLIHKEPSRSLFPGDAAQSVSFQSENLALYTAAELITNRPLLGRILETLRHHPGIQGSDEPQSFAQRLRSQIGSILERLKRFFPGLAPAIQPELSDAERQRAAIDEQIDLLLGMLSVEPVSNTRLVDIHAEHPDPITAQLIANTLVQAFVEYQAQQRAEVYKNLTPHLGDQLSDVKQKVEESERAFYAFKNTAGLFSLEAKLKQLTDIIAALNASYVTTKTDRLATDARLAKLRAVIENPTTQDWGQLPIKSAPLDALQRDLLLAQTELARAKRVYKSQHPKLTTLESAVESIEHNIRKELDNAIASLEAEHAILISRERHVESAIAQTELEMHGINKKALEYSILQRDLNTNQDVYNILLAKLRETDVTGNIQTPLTQLIEAAPLPVDPVRPRKALNLALGLVVGLMVGIGISFLREYFHRTIRTAQDVSVQLQLPVLGMIPKKP